MFRIYQSIIFANETATLKVGVLIFNHALKQQTLKKKQKLKKKAKQELKAYSLCRKGTEINTHLNPSFEIQTANQQCSYKFIQLQTVKVHSDQDVTCTGTSHQVTPL